MSLLKKLRWLNAAISSKGVVEAMTHYRVAEGEIWATDGRITAGTPCDIDGAYLVPGSEFEKVLSRMTEEMEIQQGDSSITLKSGRFRGTIATLPLDLWGWPGCPDVRWEPMDTETLDIIDALRPFMSDNATRPWAAAIGLQGGWAFATNNVAVAGVALPSPPAKPASLPLWAVDFVLPRRAGIEGWFVGDDYVGFLWEDGSWMRSQVYTVQFPDLLFELVEHSASEECAEVITAEWFDAYNRVADFVEHDGPIRMGDVEMVAGYKNATIAEEMPTAVPSGRDATLWTAKYLTPVLDHATEWDPTRYPEPCPWRGPLLHGYVLGRNH